MAEKFRAADVQIVRGYFVSCKHCDYVAEYGPFGLSRADAHQERAAHIAEHRESEQGESRV